MKRQSPLKHFLEADRKDPHSRHASCARCRAKAIGWQLIRRSGIGKEDPSVGTSTQDPTIYYQESSGEESPWCPPRIPRREPARATDAERVQAVLSKRLSKFALALEPSKTKLIKFGRSAQREACTTGQRPETFSFLGFAHYCTRNRKGNFKLGRKTEKSRLHRSIARLTELMREIRHRSLKEQAEAINRVLRGHYAYYGLAGNFWSLRKVYWRAARYWYKVLCSRSWRGNLTWEVFNRVLQRFPLQRPRLRLTYGQLQSHAVL